MYACPRPWPSRRMVVSGPEWKVGDGTMGHAGRFFRLRPENTGLIEARDSSLCVSPIGRLYFREWLQNLGGTAGKIRHCIFNKVQIIFDVFYYNFARVHRYSICAPAF